MREIYAIINANDFDIKGNLSQLSKAKNIVITFGNDENIRNNLYFDKYFNYSSRDKSVLWIVLFTGKNFYFSNNVVSIVKKK